MLDEVIGLQRLVDDLLSLARSDAAPIERSGEPVVLGSIVRDAVDRCRRRDGVVVDVSADGLVITTGNAGELARAIGNVVDNALRHASTAVDVEVHGNAERATVIVTDDGSGVPAAERERIFERFTRVDEARSTDAGGAGLGLSIAREIVQRHGGSITVDPEHDGGARFVITLPRA